MLINDLIMEHSVDISKTKTYSWPNISLSHMKP